MPTPPTQLETPSEVIAIAPIKLKVRENAEPVKRLNEGQGILKARNNSFEAPLKVRNNSTDSAVNVGKSAISSPPQEKVNSRNNSIEDAQKTKSISNINPAQLIIKTTNELVKVNQNETEKKQPVAPPPRKSSDPNKQKELPPKTIPPTQNVTQIAAKIIESPKLKHKSSNGTPPQNIPAALTSVMSPVPEPKIKVSNEGNQLLKSDTVAESNGVGDKIRKFERAAEDATGRTSRPGSIRNKIRNEITEKNNTSSNTSVSDNIDSGDKKLGTNKTDESNKLYHTFSPTSSGKWRKEEPEPPTASSKYATLRPDRRDIRGDPKTNQFAKEVSSKSSTPVTQNVMFDHKNDTADALTPTQNHQQIRTPQAPRKENQSNDDVNTQANFKTCKFKPKDKCTPAKAPSAYFTRGTEEIWMVKKKDIEEIEDRVLGSFIRASTSCVPPANTEISRNVSFAAGSNATLGRTKRVMYARSESLDPQWAASRSQTLKRQSSVACTCGHDKKSRAKGSGTCMPVSESSVPPRPRSRSHGDDHSQGHVLDKYETLV